MKNSKIVFFDIDGTLLDHDKKLPPSTKQAIASLRDLGHTVAIATGRSPFMFPALQEELAVDSLVCLNGQIVVLDGQMIYRNPMDRTRLKALTEFAAAKSHPIVYIGLQGMAANVDQHPYVETSVHSLKLELPVHDPTYYRAQDIYQCMVFCKEADEAVYADTFEDHKFVRWHELSMDVLPKGASKAFGIAQMIEKLGVAKEDVYAFGDQLNDLEMLRYVGHGVAMGNAPDIVKQAAKYVTADVADDGILRGLQMVGLL